MESRQQICRTDRLKMNSDEKFKIAIESSTSMANAFYIDFKPLIEQIQKNISMLTINENDKATIKHINDDLSKAANILEGIKHFITSSEQHKNEDVLKMALEKAEKYRSGELCLNLKGKNDD